MVGCALSQLKPSELYILSFEKDLGLYPIQNSSETTRQVPEGMGFECQTARCLLLYTMYIYSAQNYSKA